MKFLLAITLAACLTSPASAQATAFVHVNVIPMDGQRILRDQTVVVERGVITTVAPSSAAKIPAGATRIDGANGYLIPGLADVHVHLAGPRDIRVAILKMFVANGVTTVVNLKGAPEHLALRADVAEGRVLGPTIFSSGPYINEPFFTTPDEVERAVVDQKKAGYDFIKMHGSLSRSAYARLNAVARREGIRVIGHAPRNLGLAAMFEERPYAVAHAEEFIYDTTGSSRDFAAIEPRIPELARSMVSAGIWLMPNLTAFRMIGAQIGDLQAVLDRPEMKYLPASVRTGWGPATNPYTARFGKDMHAGIVARYHLLEKIAKGFQQGGVRLVVGTDAMNTGTVPGFSAHDELADLVTAGLTPYEALRAATANGAEFLGHQPGAGTVAPGNVADLVLLARNPLEDISNTRRIEGVMLRGRWLSKRELGKLLTETGSTR